MADDATQETTQDVATPQVAGRDAIADQLRHGTAVVSNHLERRLSRIIELVVVDTGTISRCLDQRKNQIRFVVVGHLLKNLSHPLQTQSRIDVPVRQRRETPLSVAVVLHEHQVVELDEAVIVFEVDALITQFRLEVVVDLRTRPTGSRRTRCPKVIGFIHADDPLGVHPHHISPNLFSLIVFSEDAHHQMLGINAVHLRTQLPSPLNRLLLEVIPKGKIAEHLEKRVMPRRTTHVLDVIGANALLTTRGPRCWPLLLTKEHRLKRQHPSNGEQHRWILWNQRRTCHHLVSPFLVEAQERRTDLSTRLGQRCCRRRRSGGSHGKEGGSCGHDRP